MKTKMGRMLGVVWLGLASLWLPLSPLSAQEPKLRDTLKGHTGEVFSVAYSPDGKTLASGGDDKMIKLWDVTTGKELATLQEHTGGVSSVAYSPDGKTLASGGGVYGKPGEIKLWDVSATNKDK